MKIYVEPVSCKCHASNPYGAYREIESPFFDGKCAEFIEGYIFVPQGEHWTREDGEIFAGEMIAPWKLYGELDAAQREYEREQYAAARAAYVALEEGLGSV